MCWFAAKPFVHTPETSTVTLTEGDTLELVCTGWGWPVPYVMWIREDRSDHVYGVSEFGVTLRDASDVVTSLTSE